LIETPKKRLCGPLQLLDRLEPVALADPFVRPDVELLHVDRLDPEPLEALFRALDDPVDAELDGAAERPERFVIVGTDPHRPADPPGAVAEHGDFEAGSPKRPIAHCRLLSRAFSARPASRDQRVAGVAGRPASGCHEPSDCESPPIALKRWLSAQARLISRSRTGAWRASRSIAVPSGGVVWSIVGIQTGAARETHRGGGTRGPPPRMSGYLMRVEKMSEPSAPFACSSRFAAKNGWNEFPAVSSAW
jgi:hypothetical protein